MADESRDVICDMCGVRLRPEGQEGARPDTHALDMKDFFQLLQDLGGLERAHESSPGEPLSGRVRFLRSILHPLKNVVEAHRASCGPREDLAGLPFGARKVGASAPRKPYFTPPPEVGSIMRGGYVEFAGLFINEGRASWNGFDVVSGQAVKVERYSGRLIKSAPEIPSPTASRFRRDASTDKYTAVEIVTTKQLRDEQLAELVQVSNVLWYSRASFLSFVTDIHNALYLRDGGEAKLFGGPGRLNGPARRLADLLDSMMNAR
jgi:hypothetical protein